jgi:hypothetical protein
LPCVSVLQLSVRGAASGSATAENPELPHPGLSMCTKYCLVTSINVLRDR